MYRLFSCVTLLCLFTTQSFAEQDIVKVSVFEEHEKYVSASNAYGISWQIIELAAEHADITLYIEELAWHASLNRVKAQKLDWAFGAIKTEEREQWANFSVPLVSEGSGIFTRLDNPASSLADIDLKNSVVGVTINSVQESLARKLGFENIYSSGQRPQLYSMLNADRLDYLFFGKSIISYYCKHFDASMSEGCMKQVGKTFLANNMHLLVDKRNKEANRLLQRLNNSVKAVSKSENAQALFKQYQLDQATHENWLLALDSDSQY